MQSSWCAGGTLVHIRTYGNMPASSQWPVIPIGDTVITLSLIQCLNIVGYFSLLSVGQYSSNTYITHDYINDESFSELQVS
jgi:hypothetical protein